MRVGLQDDNIASERATHCSRQHRRNGETSDSEPEHEIICESGWMSPFEVEKKKKKKKFDQSTPMVSKPFHPGGATLKSSYSRVTIERMFLG